MKQKFLLVLALMGLFIFQNTGAETKDNTKKTKEEPLWIFNGVSFHEPGLGNDVDHPPIDVLESSWRIDDIVGYPAYPAGVNNEVEQNGWILYLKNLRDESQIELTFFDPNGIKKDREFYANQDRVNSKAKDHINYMQARIALRDKELAGFLKNIAEREKLVKNRYYDLADGMFVEIKSVQYGYVPQAVVRKTSWLERFANFTPPVLIWKLFQSQKKQKQVENEEAKKEEKKLTKIPEKWREKISDDLKYQDWVWINTTDSTWEEQKEGIDGFVYVKNILTDEILPKIPFRNKDDTKELMKKAIDKENIERAAKESKSSINPPQSQSLLEKIFGKYRVVLAP